METSYQLGKIMKLSKIKLALSELHGEFGKASIENHLRNTRHEKLIRVAKIPCILEYTKNFELIKCTTIEKLLSSETLNIFENYAMNPRVQTTYLL